MKIVKTFKQLTKLTYPFGTESMLETFLPSGYQKDEWDNYYIQIGQNPSTMFTCHLDTACGVQEKVTHVVDKNFIKTDGKTILGADDKAGMTVLLYMIENKVPGLYYFFIGEECGCVGSGRLSRNWQSTEFSKYITKVISFDRRGTDSVITEQFYGVCCSDSFANELSSRLNLTDSTFKYRPDPTGIYTDSAKFTTLVPECTNISVGYYSEHTSNERQDIDFLQRLCKSVVQIDWETLPIVRKPGTSYSYEEDSWDFDEEDDWSSDFYSYFSTDGGDSVKMFISKSQIEFESDLISTWISQSGVFPGFKSISWDGHSLYVEDEKSNLEFLANRMDIIEMVPELSEVNSLKVRLKLD